MTRIGLVGLDTSHARAFAEYFEGETGASVAAAWDRGRIRDDDHVEAFCRDFDATLYDAVDALADAVDAAMVLTVDWDTHADLAAPLLEAGVATFVDKPVAGRVADLDALGAAAGTTPLFGGSAIPFHPRLAEFPVGTTADDRTLYAAGYNDPFYYGSHPVDTVRRLAGADWTRVRPLDAATDEVSVEFADGTRAVLRLAEPPEGAAFGFLDVADRTRTARLPAGEEREAMYGRFLDAFLDRVRTGQSDRERLLDGARLLIAVHAALDADAPVAPGDDRLAATHVDGSAFEDAYVPPS